MIRARLLSSLHGLLLQEPTNRRISKFSLSGFAGNIDGLIYSSLNSLERLINGSHKQLEVWPEFCTVDEEKELVAEVDKSFIRKRYQYDHWDGAIQGFRETEKSQWNDSNQSVISRVCQQAFSAETAADVLPYVHVLDLAHNGHIKPHIDSHKFCGSTIAGLSLLSTRVLRLQHEIDKTQWIEILLQPRSLYVIRNELRYHFTHEVLLDSSSSPFQLTDSPSRRVSLIIRNQPQTT